MYKNNKCIKTTTVSKQQLYKNTTLENKYIKTRTLGNKYIKTTTV